jgi:hypothetical protein
MSFWFNNIVVVRLRSMADGCASPGEVTLRRGAGVVWMNELDDPWT